MKHIKVASVQIESHDLDFNQNSNKIQSLLVKALHHQVDIVLLPELSLLGYLLTPQLWEYAESKDGRSVSWLKRMARTYSLSLGTTILEYEKDQFYNTFYLIDKKGEVQGTVRKKHPAVWESFFFHGDDGGYVINSDLGKIGVAICYDSFYPQTLNNLSQENLQLILMPFSFAIPDENDNPKNKLTIVELRDSLSKIAKQYATKLHTPVVLSNKTGFWSNKVPLNFFPQQSPYIFCGSSLIIDENGNIRKKMAREEGIIYDTVIINDKKNNSVSEDMLKLELPKAVKNRNILRCIESIGKTSYYLHQKQRQKIIQSLSQNPSL